MTANSIPRVVFFAVVFLVSLGAVLAPSPAYGLACGDEIRTDTVLTADLGPCPGNGLVITASITLDLAGFTISGSGGGIGVYVPLGGTVTIKGPGSITAFGTGIRISGSGGQTVQGVTLMDNGSGIYLLRTSSPRIINNTIDGGVRESPSVR